VPILVGPHTENFRDIVSFFLAQDAVRMIKPDELSRVVLDLLGDEAQRQGLGRRAAEALDSQRGATQRTLASLKLLLAERTRETTPA
jgi:3-deoxy-D-manno-octulosonic-acid transferase